MDSFVLTDEGGELKREQNGEKHEALMTKEARSPKSEGIRPKFVLRASDFLRHSDFVLRAFSAFVRDHELVEADFFGLRVAHAGEQFFHQAAEVRGANRVIVVLAIAARLDQTRNTQEGKVMADGRLALVKAFAQCGHVQFVLAGEVHQNPQASFIGEQLEDLNEILFQLVR